MFFKTTELKKRITVILRFIFATFLLVAGVYLLVSSSQDWFKNGFQVLTYGEKGKDAFSGVFFAIVFIAYGVRELFNVVKNKT
jgi:hypothetical protein